jgi:murein L,D-transpeptidase YcbB/YkuD
MGRRYVLVDAASAQLWMVEEGEVVGNMRVVVGRPGEQTPMMAGYIRHLTLNPYWNVPPDLVPRLIAPNVIRRGVGYLDDAGYEVLSDWTANAHPVDPSTIDWQAVVDGTVELRVRQRPGPANSMGRVKFMFPNDRGVYLHDTPNRELFRNDDRRNSAGCVRVEDAATLARWLFGSTPRPDSAAPEQNVDLPEPVPVYITYLTARPENGQITFHNDIYGRDRQLMASVGGAPSSSRR